MAQKTTEYVIEIPIDGSNEAVWNVLTDFNRYPEWNSVLGMEENDNLTIGDKFQVTIHKPNNKKSRFHAETLTKVPPTSFSARQIMLASWLFTATHHFIIREIDAGSVLFIQKWEFQGLLSKLFKKQIFKGLELFNKMNDELKARVEKK